MDPAALDVVYDVGRDGVRDFIPLLGLAIFVLAGFVAVLSPLLFWRDHAKKDWAIAVSWIGLIAAMTVFGLVAWTTISAQVRYSRALANGSCTLVEGRIDDLRPLDEGALFVVGGTEFRYGAGYSGEGFRGGDAFVHRSNSVIEGRFARLCYLQNRTRGRPPVILRLEVATS